ncbi:MAG: hypothetical protein DRI65_18135 [Chloroflexota bacterium]|nr:MAG: hypothetical protein DRI65_18135 [Chloroflexota bacterium]
MKTIFINWNNQQLEVSATMKRTVIHERNRESFIDGETLKWNLIGQQQLTQTQIDEIDLLVYREIFKAENSQLVTTKDIF